MLAHDKNGLKRPADHAPQGKGHGQRSSDGDGGRSRGGDRGSDRGSGRSGRGAGGRTGGRIRRRGRRAARRRLPRRRGGGETLGQGGGHPGGAGRQAGEEGDRQPSTRKRIDAEATRLIKRVVATGEFYLVRAGNTRKGTGTFYTRPQLAVPTVHRTLEPLCYDKAEDGTLAPKDARDDPRAEGLRPGLRQRLVPGRRPALPDRRPLSVALPPPATRRLRAGQAAHAPLRASSHGQG